MCWWLARSLETPYSIWDPLPAGKLLREIGVQQLRPRPGALAGLWPSANLTSILHIPPPLPFPALNPSPRQRHLFLDRDLHPKAGQPSFLPHCPVDLCMNLDLTPLLLRKGQSGGGGRRSTQLTQKKQI